MTEWAGNNKRASKRRQKSAEDRGKRMEWMKNEGVRVKRLGKPVRTKKNQKNTRTMRITRSDRNKRKTTQRMRLLLRAQALARQRLLTAGTSAKEGERQ